MGSGASGKDEKKESGGGTLVHNRKARFDYHILETYEAGIVLRGTEVKSIRAHHAHLEESFARIDAGELYLYNFHIDPYEHGNRENHDPIRKRKLLLHKHEVKKLMGEVSQKGLTLVPLTVYLKHGKVKVGLALAQGKKKGDKREAIRERSADREARTAMKTRQQRY